ncbi:MAG: methionine adenosyltransferase, partial [SAR324 cluster bacterium]|nr:methionine adenosyltransferase [SAR324 cluster bacterium]
MNESLFTSESVTEGHPDKMCDQISDAILDALIKEDPQCRVACETLTTTGLVVLAGEITSTANIDYQDIVRSTIKSIGYDSSLLGFDYRTCGVVVAIGKQSPDIAQGVDAGRGLHKEQGAGDQGLMFGFACDETKELMPLPIFLAHRLVERLTAVRRSGEIPYLGPDGKSQVTMRYADGKPVEVDTVVVSSQHTADVDHPELVKDIIDQVIRPIIPSQYLNDKTRYLINPT